MEINREIFLVGRVLLKVALFFSIVILGILLIIISMASFLKIQFNEFLLGTLAQFLVIIAAAFIAFYLFEKNNLETHKRDIRNQIKILRGLFNELLILNGENVKIYGDVITKGNLDALKNGESIGHRVNNIHFQEYITSLDQDLLNIIKINKLTRTLSYINDKIELINPLEKTHVEYPKIVNEAHGIVQNLKEILSIQIKELEKVINKL